MFLLAWGASGSRRGYSEHGTPLPLCAVVVLLASAARRLLGVAMALPRGSAQTRESLTQDSRSAVKARLFDPLRESFGEERCALRGAGVNGLERDHHVGLSASSRDETRVDAATAPLRAYVTGGASNDAQTIAMRARCGFTPLRVASSMARGTRAARRPP